MLKSIVKFEQSYREAFDKYDVRGASIGLNNTWQVHMSLESLKQFYQDNGKIGCVKMYEVGKWHPETPMYGCVEIDLCEWAEGMVVLALFTEGADLSEFLQRGGSEPC